ncbi:hypothetical protein CWE12_06885 [Aliidiomarina sedimenti]|uniref:TonB-dependent receptor n=1 Tax=Aliidiomarina sedimenti TaxID=1933879 RepID=A0ABY0C0R2_9GAMM|nr:TonB-dependent receptor [Aliidiomarina sedimenti]RUO30957.1 hypothetical protein CWE12_06885 [Aliidiomarina sedimenti]
MNQSISRLAITASLFSLALPGVASDADDSASAQDEPIERVVVTATRTRQPWLNSAGSIDRVEVDQQLPGMRIDMAEILAGIPGVQTDTRYNFAQDTRIVLRGFGARAAFGVRGVVMRLDGIPLSMPDGQAQTSSIFVDEPAHVEVLRGPIASVYGNAAGGVINLQSTQPRQSYLGASLAVGENGRQRTALNGAYVQGPFFLSGHYAGFRTDGDRSHGKVERDQYALRSGYQFANGLELIVRADDNNAPLLQDPGSLTAEQWREDPQQTFAGATVFNTRKQIRHRQQSATLRQTLTNVDWQLAAWNGQREVEQFLPFPGSDLTSSGAVIDLTRDFYGVHGQVNWRPAAFNDQWQLSLGTDIERQQDTRLGFVNEFGTAGELRRDETGDVEKTDLYALSQYALTDQLTWLLGGRVSDMKFAVEDRFIIDGIRPDDSGQIDYSEHAWTTGFNYQLTDTWSVFASAGAGFETPTLTELAYRNDGSGLNPELGPAQVQQFEFGHKWLTEKGMAQLSLFEVRTDDEIVVDQSVDGRTTYRNAAETKRQGVELSGTYQWTPILDLRGAATIIKARYKGGQLDDQRIPGVATSNLYAQLNLSPWQDQRLRASLTAQYRSRIASNDGNTEFAPSFVLWHSAVEARQQIAQWQFRQWLRIDNLLDRNYVGSVIVNQGSGRSFEPAPGRQLSAGFAVERRF